jgi:isocitrate/isopropylmalate dehydrogenase
MENLKIISKTACENITRFAFEYAVANGNFIFIQDESLLLPAIKPV